MRYILYIFILVSANIEAEISIQNNLNTSIEESKSKVKAYEQRRKQAFQSVSTTASGNKVSVCYPTIPEPISSSKCNGAKTATGKYATVELSRGGGGFLSSRDCYTLTIYTGGSMGNGNTCGGPNSGWSVITNGQNGYADGLGDAIAWLLDRM